MKQSTRPEPGPAPLDLPPVELERAVHHAVETRKPTGGWKRGRKEQDREPPKSGNG